MPDFHTEVGGAIDATHTYYNITVKNDNTVSQKAVPLVFNESREVPILVNPSEHFMSVMRFSLETTTLPVFIPIPLSGSVIPVNGPIDTIYTITHIDQTGVVTQRNILWVPEDLTVPIPEGIVSQSMYNNPYFYCYSYQHFINLINQTLLAIQQASGLSIDFPQLYYDTKTNLISVVGRYDYWRTNSSGVSLGTAGRIFFNSSLFNLVSSLSYFYVAGTLGNEVDYQITFFTGTNVVLAPFPFVINTYINPIDSQTYIRNIQEYPTVALWTPVKSIIFKTSLLTNVPELQGIPQITGYIKNNTLTAYPIYNPAIEYGAGSIVLFNSQNFVLNYLLTTAVTPGTSGATKWIPYTIPTYSPQAVYSLGQYVTYGSVIYRLTTPIINPGTQPNPAVNFGTSVWVTVGAIPAYSNIDLYTVGTDKFAASVVSYSGSNWILKVQPNRAIQPIPASNWTLTRVTTVTNFNPSNADVLNVLIEHSVALTNGTEYKPYIYYEPTGEYRLTDLYGQMPINQVDLQALWKDNFGNLNEIYLPVGSSASIKILFRKKSFNSDLL